MKLPESEILPVSAERLILSFKRNFSFFLIIMCCFFIAGCAQLTGKSDAGKESKDGKGGKGPKGPPSVVVEPAIRKTVPIYGDFAAKIDPTNGADIVEIRARADAYLISQHFKEGDPVKKGQLLFTLDSRPYEANLKLAQATLEKAKADQDLAEQTVAIKIAESNLVSAKAQLELAKLNTARLKPLMQKKAVPRQDYDNAVTTEKVAKAKVTEMKAAYKNSVLNKKVDTRQADSAIQTANAQINKANIDIEYCYIKSPIDGITGKRQVSPGNLVGHGEATLLTTVTALDPLRVNFAISESDYLKLHKKSIHDGLSGPNGDNLTLILSDGSKYPHKGKIIIQEPMLDPKTNTLSITAQFPNPEKLLRPGMFGRINMVTEYRENAVLVPLKAVMVIQNIQYCYVVNQDNAVEMRSLQLEEQQAGKMAIVREGLKPGEKVIVEGLLKVKPGMTVKIVPHTNGGKQGAK
ncbi:MAG: efflux RND transporter periplasmic adaptor subunit [Firmicutes bacterium]|nr:efflux RND transporter periplasmic adaptor subunit [Bacillota bacterium]